MGIEIERRFIVNNNDWKLQAKKGNDFQQGYLNTNSGDWTIRVRIINEESAFLTLKSIASEFINHEFEYEIPIEDGKSLMLLCKYQIFKTRYNLQSANSEWVVDCFHGNNSPLVLAEIELGSISEEFEIPSWCNKEITGLRAWSNASLAKEPISDWPISKRLDEKLE